jgi:hypothetical protein
VLFEIRHKISYPLHIIFNKSLSEGILPDDWKIAILSPIFSPPDPKVVCRKLFQKSSPLKVLDQWKLNLVRIITRVSSFKIVSGDAVTKNRTYGKIAGFG